MTDFEKIKAFLDEKQDEMISRLMEFVEIPSVSDDKPAVKESLRYILRLAKEMGFRVSSALDESVGVIEFGEGKETLGILAHVDVVPPGDEEKWVTPPFQPALRDGAVYGRGTLDDKGAVIASLYALKAVESLRLPFYKKVQIILGTQEEVEWTDMEEYVKTYPLPDYGFTPDGEFPICNIEKGIGSVTLSLPFDTKSKAANGVTLLSVNGGTAKNIVPGKCAARILVFDQNGGEKEIELVAGGKSVHACSPEKGDNAIVNMCKALKNMRLSNKNAASAVSLIADELSDLYCGPIGVDGRSEYYNGEYIHRNCMSPTIIQTENERITVCMDMRIAYGTSPEEILAGFDKLIKPRGGSLLENTLVPATYIDKNMPFMDAFAGAYETATGLKNEFSLAYGGSYAKAMPNIVAWGPIFPGDEDTCHEENEYISIESLKLSAAVYGEAIRRIALVPDSFL